MDDFFKGTDVKAHVDAGNLVYLENDALLNKLLKAFQFGGDGIVTRIECRQQIAPDLIRLRDLAGVPVSVRNLDSDIRQKSAALIFNRSCQRCSRGLTKHRLRITGRQQTSDSGRYK